MPIAYSVQLQTDPHRFHSHYVEREAGDPETLSFLKWCFSLEKSRKMLCVEQNQFSGGAGHRPDLNRLKGSR